MLLNNGRDGKLTDRLRRTAWVMPILVPLYVLLFRGGILSGRAGWIYALQRTLAEILIALEIGEQRLSALRETPAAAQQNSHQSPNAKE